MSVRRRIVILGISLIGGLLLVDSALGQRPTLDRPEEDKSARGTIRGMISLPGGGRLAESAKVTLMTFTGTVAVIFSDNSGGFEFTELSPGNYEVQVETNGTQFDGASQTVQVFRGSSSLVTISLRDKTSPTRRTNAKNSVSVGELGPDVPKAARKEFELATRVAQEKRIDEAIGHLRKAIAIYPSFVMAHNDLGTLLLAQGKLDEAEQQLRQAILIDDKAFNPRLNLGIVLVQENKFAEAAEALDRAIALSSDSPAARLYAGLAQTGLSNWDSAERHFRAAYVLGGSSYSLALFHLGQVCMNKGEREEALKAFENYLRDSPAASNADQVRKLITMLSP